MPIFSRSKPEEPGGLPVDESGLEVHDVTAFAMSFDLNSLTVLQWAPVWMSRAERLLLFTLTFTLRPSRYLEIGTLKGGSALLVNAALDALGSDGRLVCVDPEPQISPEHWEMLNKRTTLITGASPDVLPEAEAAAGGPFDFVLIDGDHSYDGILRDAEGVLPFVTDNGYLLFHDSLSPKVAQALNEFAQHQTHQIVDFGTLTREVTYVTGGITPDVRWGGLRLMQLRRR